MVNIPELALRPQTLIVTLYGLYGREAGGSFPVSALVSMMGDLGRDAPSVRSAVSRLKSKGVLSSVRTQSGPGYAISEKALDLFATGDSRIFEYPRAGANDPWVLAIYSVPEEMRNKRYQLRQELGGLGFGMVSSGVWIAPALIADEAKHRLEDRGLLRFVEFFTGSYDSNLDMRLHVERWWNLNELDAQFGAFIGLFGPGLDEWQGLLQGADGDASDEVQQLAFRYFIPLVTLWRRLPYRDPGLPLEYLPSGWRGPAAAALFHAITAKLKPIAARHAKEAIRGSR